MGFFSRLFNVIRSQANSALDAAEDPEKMLNQMITDMETQKRQAKEQMAQALAEQKKLERVLEKERAEAKKWEEKAVLSVQKERDDLAKEALLRKKEHTGRALEYEKQLSIHTQNTGALRNTFQQLEDKIDEIKRKKGLLITKKKQAEVQSKMYKTLEGMDNTGAIDTIERMEEKIEDMSAKAEAYQELTDTSGKDRLEKEFEELGSSSVDAELLELKQKALLEHKTDDKK